MAEKPTREEIITTGSLSESEKRYRAIFEKAAVGIVHCCLDGRFLEVNRSFADFVGYSCNELQQFTFQELTYPEDIDADAAGIRKLFSGELSQYINDKRYIHKDGRGVWGHVTVSLMVDDAGKPKELLAVIQDIHTRKRAEEALRESEHRHKVIFENSPLGMIRFDQDGKILDCNEKFVELMGSTREKLIGFNTALQSPAKMQESIHRALSGEPSVYEDKYSSVTGGKTTYLRVVFNPVNPGKSPTEVIATLEDVTERRLASEVIERRIFSLTQPLVDGSAIAFEDLFNLEDIQRLQDEFACATGVASIITRTDGTPITQPSNFTRLCRDIIRKSPKGLMNCCKSDAALGRLSKDGPLLQPCLSGGLWDAGAGISVGGHHIANWLIGQVRDETQTEETIKQYAIEIGADEDQAVEAFQEVPTMSQDQFEAVGKVLYTLANRLSMTAYQNVQQARIIAEIKATQEKLLESENRLRFALEGANDGLLDANLSTGKLYYSDRAHHILGYAPGEINNLETDWQNRVHPEDFQHVLEKLVAHFKKLTSILRIELRMRMKNGDWKWILVRGKVVEWGKDGRALRLTGTLTDIDQRKKIEETQIFLLERDRSAGAQDFFLSLARYLGELLQMEYVCIDRLEGDKLSACSVAIYRNGHFADNVTYTLGDTLRGNVVGKTICCYEKGVSRLFPQDAVLQDTGAESYVGTTLWDSRGKEIGLISIISRKPLTDRVFAESIIKLAAIRAAGEIERLAAEEEKNSLQLQLMQAQKMESVGRLAGGVAHDFNNMLGVILGHVEMAQEQIDSKHPLYFDLEEVRRAAKRSADLTRQLLAFARKQTISPKVLDLNETIEGSLKMLRRLIGEDIDLAWLPGKGIWPVKIDPSQIDQILANLTVNARDAIAGVGRVTIETANIAIDEDYCLANAGFIAGEYVMLSVSDDGCGMGKDVMEHVFEPFFTTKEIGSGTGLGLATIYGIVKQNGGLVHVYSEPEKGTTFSIYLLKYVGMPLGNSPRDLAEKAQEGVETILLVEDESSILQLAKRMLELLGYHVLAAPDPWKALSLAEHYAGEIHLLLTDVVMPEMNGRELAKRLLFFYPDIKQLFMSGYTADVIAHHGVLDEGVQFIQKPFSKTELSIKVRDTLAKN